MQRFWGQRPTDEDLYGLAAEFNGDPVPAMRRALELWGNPTQGAPAPEPQTPPTDKAWWDEGDHVDELRDITVKDINNILEWDNSMVQIEVFDDEEDEDDGTPIPILYNDKVTLRDVHTVDSDDWIDDDDDYQDDGDDDVWEPEDHNTE